MGRDSVAAKARRQAAAAAAAGQGAVAEPVAAAAQPVEPQGGNPFGFLVDDAAAASSFIRTSRESKEAERSFDRVGDTISIFYTRGNLAQESRNVLDATVQLRDAAERMFRKLRQDERSAQTPARAQEARQAIRQLATGMYGVRSAQFRIRRIAENRPNESNLPQRISEAGRDLIVARNDARNALRILQQANATANLDIRVLRNGILN